MAKQRIHLARNAGSVRRTRESRVVLWFLVPLFGLRSSTTSWLGLLWLSSQGLLVEDLLREGSIFDTLYTEKRGNPKWKRPGTWNNWEVELNSDQIIPGHTIRIMRRRSVKFKCRSQNQAKHHIVYWTWFTWKSCPGVCQSELGYFRFLL